jgi:Fe-S cluster biosynthesis and repair protein YggX
MGKYIGKGMLWGAAAGAAFTTLSSENFRNWTKGKGFYNNEKVYQILNPESMQYLTEALGNKKY